MGSPAPRTVRGPWPTTRSRTRSATSWVKWIPPPATSAEAAELPRRCTTKRPTHRHGGRGRYVAVGSVALHVDDLAQRVPHLDQVCRVLHHDVDVLVRAGDLVDELARPGPLDALHRLDELLVREGPLGVPTPVLAPGPVR